MPNINEILGSAAAIAKGMGVTFKEMMSPTVTDIYPDEPAKLQERYRGVHRLERDENGMEKCVACFLCSAACPANCIYIEAAENTDVLRISGGERYAKTYNIDYSRCIFCGFCVEACPEDAIRMSKDVPNFPGFDRDNMWATQDLLMNWQPNRDPAKRYPDARQALQEVHP